MKFVRQSLPTGIISAVLYLAITAFFVFNSKYDNIFLLSLASCVFAGGILLGVIRLNYTAHDNAGAIPMFTAGWQSTLIGVILCSLGSLIIFGIQSSYVPENEVLEGMPIVLGSNNKELFMSLMLHSLGVNGVLGLGAAGLGTAVTKRNQKTMGGNQAN